MSTTFNPSYNGRVTNDPTPGLYATCHDATDGTSANDNETTVNGPGNKIVGAEYIIDRNALLFDTSGIGAGATNVSATLRIYVNSVTNADSDSLSVVNSQQASNTTLGTADFDQIGDAVTSPTKFATDTTFAGLTTGAYNDFGLNASGIAAISFTGITKLGLRTAKDCSKTTPTGQNFINFDQKDGTNKPQLVVDYTPGNVSISVPIATVNTLGLAPILKINVSLPIGIINILGIAPTLAITGQLWTNVSKNSASLINITKNSAIVTNTSKNSASIANVSKNAASITNISKNSAAITNQSKS